MSIEKGYHCLECYLNVWTLPQNAMLELYCARAKLEDGMDILDLGCGWGSLCLFLAEVSRSTLPDDIALTSDGGRRSTQIHGSKPCRTPPPRRSTSILKDSITSPYIQGTSEYMTSRLIFG